MIDYASLSHEEIKTLCGWIGESAFKDYFEKNQRTFVRIYRDCRVKKLSMTQICDIVYRNRSEKFIVQFLDDCSQQLLTLGQKMAEEIMTSGDDEETALVKMLAESPFIDNIPLYFKLKEEERSEDYIRMTMAAVTIIVRQKEQESEHESESEEEQAANENIQAQLEDQNQRIAELEQQIKELRLDGEQAEAELAAFYAKEQMLQQRRYVKDYVNTDYQHLSICRVSESFFGDAQIRLLRLADVINGILIPFQADLNQPKLFDNRDWLYKIDGPNNIEYYGAWEWSADKNWSDPIKDYVRSRFNEDCIPIEIIETKHRSSIKELAHALSLGVSTDAFCSRMLWCFRSKSEYVGLLIDKDQMIPKGQQLVLDENVFELPVYRFSTDDVIILGSKRKMFLRRIDPGVPSDLYMLYDPIETMKKMLLDIANWSVVKTSGINKSQWQLCRTFLMQMSTNGLIQDFCSKFGSTTSNATQYLNELLLQADQYLDGQDIPTATLIHAIQSSEKLSEYCAGLIRDDWEKKHFQEINEAQEQLKQVQAEVLSEKAHLVDVRSRKATIEVELREKESLADGVEKRIADRIAAAKQDAAQFISDMAFCTPIPTQLKKPVPSSVLTVGEQAENDNSPIRDYDYLLGNIQDELIEAGIDPEKALALGAFLYAAYCNRLPVLLAGPNSLQIANVMSVSLTGNIISTIDCNQEYVPEWTQEIETHDIEIVAFRNPFHHDWIHSIMEQLEAPRCFFILLHPFAEDLCIEPAGLMNYVLPVLTEAFVTGKATGNYTGSVFSDNFAHYQPAKSDIRLYASELKKLVSQSILRSNIQQILTDAHTLVPEMNEDVDMLLGLVPAAYILGKGDTLLSVLEDSSLDIKQSQRFLRAIMGKDE